MNSSNHGAAYNSFIIYVCVCLSLSVCSGDGGGNHSREKPDSLASPSCKKFK